VVTLSLRRQIVKRSPPTGASPFSIVGATLSDRGQVREGNEDSVYLEPAGSSEARARGTLCMVADGMGGYAAGEVASRLAIEGVRERYYASSSTYIVDALRDAIEATNLEVWQYAQHDTASTGMGCTLTAAVILGDDLVIGHVGDSRAYLVRSNECAQMTKDHSWVEGQVDLGALTREQANQHPQRNIILRAIGPRSAVEVDIVQHKIADGDVILLCSDGLSTLVSDEEIGRIASHSSPAEIVNSLVTLANERGAPDNVTVAALQIHSPIPKRLSPFRGQRWWMVAVALTVASIFAFSIVAQNPVRTDATPAPEPGAPIASAQNQPVLPSPSRAVESPAPRAESTVAPGEELYVINGANLRSAPHLNENPDNVVGELSAGQAVVIDSTDLKGSVPQGETNATWYQVHVPGRQNLSGWLWAGNVQRRVPRATPMPPELTASVTPIR
jgi:PPM family protein phosphatase